MRSGVCHGRREQGPWDDCWKGLFAARSHLRGTPCRSFIADMKVRVAAASAYYYPDIVLTCAEGDLAPNSAPNFIEAPKVVTEVLSPATEKVDRREKWFAYCELESLEDYVLIDQERQWVEVFRRQEAGWVQEIARARETITLSSLGLTLPLAAIYEDSGVTPETVPAPD